MRKILLSILLLCMIPPWGMAQEQVRGSLYDRSDRLVGQTHSAGFAVGYRYDANGNLIRRVLLDHDPDADGASPLSQFLAGVDYSDPEDGLKDSDGDGWTDAQEIENGSDPNDPDSVPNLVGPKGESLGLLECGFTPSGFVMAAGDLDGHAGDEIVIAADGDTGEKENFLKLLRQQAGGSWTSELISVGDHGVTSIAIGDAGTGYAAIYCGLRHPVEKGSIVEIRREGHAWTTTTLARSQDAAAHVLGVRNGIDLMTSYTDDQGSSHALHAIACTDGQWQASLFDAASGNRGALGTVVNADFAPASLRLLDEGGIQIKSGSTVKQVGSGLEAYFPFDGNAEDVSENAFFGAVSNATLAQDRSGEASKAYSFAGNGTITVDSKGALSFDASREDYSVSGWVMPAAGSDGGTVVSDSGSAAEGYSYKIYLDAALKLRAEIWDMIDLAGLESSQALMTGKWTSFALVVRDGCAMLYVGNQLEASCRTGEYSTKASEGIVVGSGFEGAVDELRIFSRAIVPWEVALLADAAADGIVLPEEPDKDSSILAAGALAWGDAGRMPAALPPPPPPGYHWVSITNQNPPADSGIEWKTINKSTQIQPVINNANVIDGDVIIVNDGTYAPIVINKEITIQSLNGRDAVAIDGGGTARCVDMQKKAILRGLTVKNGYQSAYSSSKMGSGVHMPAGGGIYDSIVENCKIMGEVANSYSFYGAGVYAGQGSMIEACIIRGNVIGVRQDDDDDSINLYGAGLYFSGAGRINDCKISGNNISSDSYGGVRGYGAGVCGNFHAVNTQIYENGINVYGKVGGASARGGGCYGGKCSGSVIRSNTATANSRGMNTFAEGGGACGSVLENCLITDNRISGSNGDDRTQEARGGGAYGGRIENSVLARNKASASGGYYSSWNSALGGGACGSSVYNSIVYMNSGSGGVIIDGLQGGKAYNCLVFDDTNSVEDTIACFFDKDPLFVDPAGDDFRLQDGSPAIDAGCNDYVTEDADLDGMRRIAWGRVDMGAYEHGSVTAVSEGRRDAAVNPSVFHVGVNDANGSGRVDVGDVMSVTEYMITATEEVRIVGEGLPIASAASQIYSSAAASLGKANIDSLYVGMPDGRIHAWDPVEGGLDGRIFTERYLGKAWHGMSRLATVDGTKGLAGLMSDPRKPKECRVLLWDSYCPVRPDGGEAKLQTAPSVAILADPGSGTAVAGVRIVIADAEANPCVVQLEYDAGEGWRSATINAADGVTYRVGDRLTASPAGMEHLLLWNAGGDLGEFVGTVSLRARAMDMSLTGDWSAVMTPYVLDTTDTAGLPGVNIAVWPETVEYAIETATVSGNCTPDVVGDLVIRNERNGFSAGFPVSEGWTSPAIPLEHGDNEIVVEGANVAGFVVGDRKNIFRQRYDAVLPVIQFAGVPAWVSEQAVEITVSGLVNDHAVGDITLVNATTGQSLSCAVAANWSIAGVQLAIGTNELRASVANAQGRLAHCSATVHRVPKPVVTITSVPATVPYTTPEIQVFGTANGEIVGQMWIVNELTGDVRAFMAATDWSVAVPLGVGENRLAAHGRNAYGGTAADAVVMRRQPPQADADITIGFGLHDYGHGHVVHEVQARFLKAGTEEPVVEGLALIGTTAGEFIDWQGRRLGKSVQRSLDTSGRCRALLRLDEPGEAEVSVEHLGHVANHAGLRGYYPLNGDAAEASGNSAAGTVHGAVPSADRHGGTSGCLLFDGVDDHVDIGGLVCSLRDDAIGALSVWFNPASVVSGNAVFSVAERGNGNASLKIFFDANNKLNFQSRGRLGTQTIISDGKPAKNAWHHVVITNDGASTRMYLNGQVQAQVAGAQWFSEIANLDTLRLGQRAESDSWFFKGMIDELRVYGRALDASEVETLFGATHPSRNSRMLPYYEVASLDDAIPSGESMTLRKAVESANALDFPVAIRFPEHFAERTCQLGGEPLAITGKPAILGPWGSLVISGNQLSRVFDVASGAELILDGLTITGGNDATAGGISNVGQTTLVNATVCGNSGGIRNEGVLLAVQATITDNADFGIMTEAGGTTTLRNSIVAGNDADLVGDIAPESANNIVDTVPLLWDIPNSDGDTLYHVPDFTSPAINAGDAAWSRNAVGGGLPFDQSGFARILGGGVDAGSIEGDYCRVEFRAGDHGTISGDTVQTVPFFWDTTDVTVVPDAGYRFLRWSDGSTENPRRICFVMTDITVTAEYSVLVHDVVFAEGEHGTRIAGGELVQAVAHGQPAVAPTIQADSGWCFIGWDAPFNAVTTTLTVNALYEAEDPGRHALAVVNGTGGGLYAAGQRVLIAAHAPGSGRRFHGWEHDGEGLLDDASCSLTVFTMPAADAMVTAQYADAEYVVSFDLDGKGVRAGGGELVQAVACGKAATAPEVMAAAGFRFVGWDRPFGHVVEDMLVTAQYEAQHALTVRGGSGSGHYDAGTVVKIAASVPAGHRFIEWAATGAIGEFADRHAPQTDYLMPGGDAILEAVVEPGEHVVEFVAEGRGVIAGELRQVVPHGGDCSPVTAIPAPGHALVGWSGGLGDDPALALTEVTADMRVVARFELHGGGLVAHYALDGNADDAWGDNHGQELGAVSYADGRIGQALVLNGTNAYVDAGDMLDIGESFTFATWFRINNSASNAWRTIFMKQGDASGFGVRCYPGTGFQIYHSGNGSNTQITHNVQKNVWFHLAVSYDGRVMRLYLNGSEIHAFEKKGLISNPGNLILGASVNGATPGNYWFGNLDDFKVYAMPLDAAGVYDLYRGLDRSTLGLGLLAHYPLDGDGVDATGHGFDADTPLAPGISFDHGKKGMAAGLDGASSFSVGAAPADSYPFSISAWAKIEPGEAGGAICHLGSSGSEVRNVGISIVDGKAQMQTRNGTHLLTTGNAAITSGAWVHVVGVWESANSRLLYVDGVLDVSDAEVLAMPEVDRLRIGSRADSTPDQHFRGMIDDVRIYGRGLSEVEVRSLFLPQGDPTLLAHYRMDGNPRDSGIYERHGVARGALPGEDRFGAAAHAYAFDGISQAVDTPLSGEMKTFSLWFRPDAAIGKASVAQCLVDFSKSANNAVGDLAIGDLTTDLTDELISIKCASGKYHYWRDTDLNSKVGTTVVTGDWHHLLITWSGNNYWLYYDGVAIGNSRVLNASGVQMGMSNPIIGCPSHMVGGKFNAFAGRIDDFRVYSRTLTATEAIALYGKEKERYLLSVVNGSGSGSYAWEDAVMVTASPAAPGERFQRWLSDDGGGFDDASASATTFRMPANNTQVIATYVKASHVISATAGVGGYIAPSGTSLVLHDGNLAYDIVPEPGYGISDVLVDGQSVGAVGKYVFVEVACDRSIEAVFVESDDTLHDLVSSAGPNGTITPLGTTQVRHGNSKTYAATANEGHHVLQVTVDGVPVYFHAGNRATFVSYSFSEVVGGHAIHAEFAVDTYAVRFVAGPNGSLSGNTSQTVSYGGNTTGVSPVPDSGHDFTGWSGDHAGVESPLVLSGVVRDMTVAASFDRCRHLVVFDLQDKAVRIGGGELEQQVYHGGAAQAPEISVLPGWVFKGWDYLFDQVTAPITVTAQYAKVHTVTFDLDSQGVRIGGGELVQSIEDGMAATAPIVSSLPGRSFNSWDTAFDNVGADITVTALYDVFVYAVEFDLDGKGSRTGGGELLQAVEHGQAAESPVVEGIPGWAFDRWAVPFDAITADTVVTALYLPVHTVEFDLAGKGSRTDGGELTQQVVHGQAAEAPIVEPNPGWLFAGWDADFSGVTSDLLVTALYDEHEAPEEGLIAFFKFNGTPLDDSGKGNHGTIRNNVIPATDRHGSPQGCYHFDGANSCVQTSASATLAVSTQLSLSAWLFMDDFGSQARRTIAVQGTSFDTTGNWEVYCHSDGTVSLHRNNDKNIVSDGSLPLGEWCHVAVTFASGEAKFYFNGVLDSTKALGANAFRSASDGIKIGEREYKTPLDDFHGMMDDVRIYNRTLNAVEVQSLYLLAPVYRVAFDEGGHGTRTGGGELVQWVKHADPAMAPEMAPDEGWNFVGWDGEFDTITGPTAITALYELESYAVAFSAVGNGSVNGVAQVTQSVSHGHDAASVEAIPDFGYRFTGWTGDHVGGENPLTLMNVTSDMAVFANFAVNQYALAYHADSHGMVSGPTRQTVTHGEDGQPVLAEPMAGYAFSRWSDGRTDNPRTDVGVTGPVEVTAEFAIILHTVTFMVNGNGSLDGVLIQEVAHGDDCTPVIAQPAQDHRFAGWTGDHAGDENPLTLRGVASAMTVVANFALSEYTVTFQTDGTEGAALEGVPVQVVAHGADCTPVKALPPPGYAFVAWSGDHVGMENPLTLTGIVSNLTVTAHFRMHQVAEGSVFMILAEEVDMASATFTSKPKTYAEFLHPVSGGQLRIPAKVLTRIGTTPQEAIACEWTRRIRIYDHRAFRASEAIGIGAADWINVETMADQVMDLRVAGKDMADQSLRPLALAVPVIDEVSPGEPDSRGNATLVIRGRWFGARIPKVWREYSDSKGRIRRQAMKVFKPDPETGFGFRTHRGLPSCMDPETGESLLVVRVPAKEPVTLNGVMVLENQVGMAFASSPTESAPHVVVDLVNGEMVELSHAPEDLLTNPDYKETLMVFRQVPAGTFLMGSDDGELGRGLFETRHQVTLTQDYWIGVFEVTQAQYQYVMGMNPSTYLGAHRPVETVSWDAVRGGAWPGGAPGEGTFMDRLGILCGNALAFDLPTEAQWEYACRAETTTALNNGKNLTDTSECPNMAEVGRYFHNTPIDEPGHAAVGFYTPNSWGIYDMHGNVGEFCLDWVSDTDYNGDEVDPAGPAAVGYPHRNRGGSFGDIAMNCRSACRGYPGPVEMGAALGFRAVFAPR